MSETNRPIEIDGQSLITGSLVRSARNEREGSPGHEAPEAAIGELTLILELAQQGFAGGTEPGEVVKRLVERLHRLRTASLGPIWDELVPIAQAHPVRELIHQDPFTRWSAAKPRGYSGDASLLDLYYKHPSMAEEIERSSDLGRAIYGYTSEDPSCAAGRERCRILAATVDEVAARVGPGTQVLAMAAGHLREAELCRSLSQGLIERWVALDQDPVSVGTMLRDHAGTAVQPMNGSVLGIMRRSYDLGSFDLVYASGLYDYLQHKTAVKLLQRLVEMVKPGGTFLFANFSDEITADGYMETFMDWPLILRSADDMWSIIKDSVDRNQFEADVWYGENRNIVYGTLRRR